jgi:hypothetical protein
MLTTNDVGETLPEGMDAAGDHTGKVICEMDGAKGVALVRARDAAWRAEIDAAVLAEREACARIAEAPHERMRGGGPEDPQRIAAAIRARGQAPQPEPSRCICGWYESYPPVRKPNPRCKAAEHKYPEG